MESDLVLKCWGVRIDQPGQCNDACRDSQSLPAHWQATVVRNRPGKGRGGSPLGMRGYKRDRGDGARPASAASIIGRGRAPLNPRPPSRP
jgi:hypothetical protein